MKTIMFVAALIVVCCVYAAENETTEQKEVRRLLEMSPFEHEEWMRRTNADLWAAVQRDSKRLGCKADKPCKGQPKGCRGNHGCIFEEEMTREYYEKRK